jgi:glycosyltransferase involved in cell wall biosynthesis
MSKSVLIDLSALRDLYCGLGQVALSYGRYFEKNYRKANSAYSLTLLVPDKMIGKFGNEVSYLSSSRKLTRKFQFLLPKFDVWHSIHQSTRFKPQHSETKYILTIHDLNYLYEKKGLNRLSKHWKLQQKINRADEIVCISEFAKAEVEEHTKLKGKKCHVIYNHVEPLHKSKSIEPEIEIKNPFFFSIGVIQRKKNFHVLLDLMKLYPDKHLYIAGKEAKKAKKNEYAEMIKSRIVNENITNVTLLGGISHEEKIWMYENCEAFLYPSLFEGFGLPVIEAMQFGKAVFCSQETSLKEIGGEHAFFWDNFEAETMKLLIDNHLEAFYNNKEKIQKEIEYAMSFTSDSHFKQYEKIYETI